MLLLITGSGDGTSDRLVSRYGSGVFRLNYDLWRDYVVSYTPGFWRIKNPFGLEITSETATSVFWWKAFAFTPSDDRLIRAELKYFLRDLYGWFETRGLSRGNSVDYHNKYGKLNVLGIAKRHFEIPDSIFSIGLADTENIDRVSLVAKSLSSEISDEKTVMLTSVIPSVDSLNPKYPWFLQAKVESDWDVTVFLCDENLFAFRRSRKSLKGIDWRAEQDFTLQTQEWFPFSLDEAVRHQLLSLANDLKVEIGRFDFMTKGSGAELIFLEFNATGQWVFLDVKNQYGLLDAVVSWLKKK